LPVLLIVFIFVFEIHEIINQKTSYMKKSIFLSLILILALTINIGCEALDVEKEITFDIEFAAYSDAAAFSATELLAADSLSDVIAEYDKLIKDIELLEVSFQITAVGDSCEATKINISVLSVADENGGGSEVIANIENQDIAALPIPIPLPLNQAGIDRFEQLIKNSPHRALISNNGTADGAPVDFTVKFFFKIKMTANPL
jgi:hypothetical protein